MFHRSIDEDSSARILQSFKSDHSELKCLFSTVAFGMGVQIPNVELIVHWGVPKSVLSYWQEVGRGGRDGRAAYAVCFAYGRSLSKRITDEKMITLAQTSMKKDTCARYAVLKNLEVKGMDLASHLNESGQACNGCGDQCPAAKCCTFCSLKCRCGNQTIQDEFGIPSLL
jgi:superfamily II DNA helicase RecQ